jgi:hypothetical protein
MSEAECRRRLHQAYTILLDAARKKEAASGDDLGGLTPDTASDTAPQGDDATVRIIEND